MKQFISKTIGFMLVLSIILTGIPAIQVQAASKPVISSSQVKIKKNACSVKKGKKIKLAAKYGKKDITKKGTWKSSKKSVATISKTGVLTAKKAGTTYITVKYKGKTSKKLKVVVKANTKPAPEADDTSGKSFTITYNKNSKNKSDKLNGSAKQKVASSSGEILKFSTTVTPASGKKFLGWYDAPTGGNRIYETYKPSGDMTLYAHYTDENTQQITFSLGCNYGGKEVSFMGYGDGYDYTNKILGRGPMDWQDSDNLLWQHNYLVNDKRTVTVDSLPVPYMEGYTFKGWYTTDQSLSSTLNKGIKVEANQEIGTDVTMLYARFSKKLTISFDDLHGGVYDDIVIDTYTSAKESGFNFPVPDIPGVNFKGWSVSSSGYTDNADSYLRTLGSGHVFSNIVGNVGYECHNDAEGHDGLCLALCRDSREFGVHLSEIHGTWGKAWSDFEFFEETDHITLYAYYERKNVIFEFDPNGGKFAQNEIENPYITVYDHTEGDFRQGFGYDTGLSGDLYYGTYESYIPGHEGQSGWKTGHFGRSIPKVTRKNYIFDGWIFSDGSKLSDSTLIKSNATLTAKWLPGQCVVTFRTMDGSFTSEEKNQCGIDATNSYKVTTESTISGSGKRLPVPVSSEGRQFEGWFTKDGEEVTKDTKITKDTTLYARWGTKTESKPETQKPSTDKDNSVNKDTDSNNKNETVHATDMTMTDMEWKPVDKTNNHYTVEYGGKGNQTGLGFTANVLPMALKDSARNVIWTSSNPDIISVTAGKEVIYSPNWFDYFEFGSDTGDVVLTATSEDNPNVSFNINVTVIKK